MAMNAMTVDMYFRQNGKTFYSVSLWDEERPIRRRRYPFPFKGSRKVRNQMMETIKEWEESDEL